MMKASPRDLPPTRKPMRVLRSPETSGERVASVLRTHFENERIRHRFERCKLRGASHGPRRACRAAQALEVQDGPSKTRFCLSEARARRKENL